MPDTTLADQQAADWLYESEEQAEGTSYLDLLRIGWSRKSLLALGLVVGLLLGSLYYARTPPVYQSSADVLVVKKRPDVLGTERLLLSRFEDYISTHTALIKSPLIVQQAVAMGDLQSLSTFAGSGDIAQSVIGRLEVSRGSRDLGSGSSNILTLSFSCGDAEDCAAVINAVLQSYKEFLQVTYRDQSDNTIAFIEQARDFLKDDIQKQEEDYRNFREQSPLLIKGPDEVNPSQQRLALIETQRAQLLLKRAEWQAQLAAIQQAQDQDQPREEVLRLVRDLAQSAGLEGETNSLTAAISNAADPLAGTADEQLFRLQMDERRLLELFGKKHPHVRALQQQIQMTREYHASRNGLDAADEPLEDLPEADPVESFKAYLQNELDRIAITDNALDQLYESAFEDAKSIADFELREEEYRRNVDRSQQLYNELLRQLQEASLVKDYGGFQARIISPPRAGGKIAPQVSRIFTVAGLLGLMGGCGLIYLAEVADTRFRSPDEIRRRLGLTVVGHVAQFTAADDETRQKVPASASLDPMLCTVFSTRGVGSEAYRGLRTALYFNSRGQTHNVIQVTSPTPGDGKTTVVSNLAVSIAQSGKRTLLIDADLRKSRQHKIFDVSNKSGLGSVIAMDHELQDVIQPTSIGNLWVMPSGPLPPDPAELLTSPKFPDLIQTVREQYEYVLIDTGPLLVVSDPCIVAPRVDGVLVVLNLANNGRKEARRSKEILASLDTNVLGVVVNGIGGQNTKAYGYGYGNYGYRYGYGYNYGYGYYQGYHEQENGQQKKKPRNRKTRHTLLPWRR